jgi:phospholipid-binding lipoprotein MlaA
MKTAIAATFLAAAMIATPNLFAGATIRAEDGTLYLAESTVETVTPSRKTRPSRHPGFLKTRRGGFSRTSPAAAEPKSTPVPQPVEDSGDQDDEFADDWDDPAPSIADPIQPVNRGVFWINDQLYNYALRPVLKVYTTVIPRPLRDAVKNAYDNVEYPVRAVNHLLQAEPGRADLETRKFVINSVAGVGGLIKVSDRFPDLKELPNADTGQTFAKWGIDHGPYIVWPVIGPRSARDTVGLAGDVALNPLTWLPFIPLGDAVAIAISNPGTVRSMEERLDAYDAATENTIDPYLSLRESYIQYREKAVSE